MVVGIAGYILFLVSILLMLRVVQVQGEELLIQLYSKVWNRLRVKIEYMTLIAVVYTDSI